ncbi:MAG: hypothetical protein V3U78_10805 [Thiotrichaceae bacterium]
MNRMLPVLALSCAISSAYAGDFNYNFVEGALITNDIEDADTTFGLKGSYDVATNVNIVGSFFSTGLPDVNGVDVSLSSFSIGLGYHKPMSEKTDFVGDIQYINYDIDLSQGNAFASVDVGDGFGVNAGIRHSFSEKFEGEASVNYIDLDFDNLGSGSDTSFSATGRYLFTDNVSASLGFSTADDSDVMAALRYSF